MKTNSLTPFIQKLLEECGRLLVDIFTKGVTATEKADQSLVTIADQRADDLIKSTIQSTFPEDGLFMEESGVLQGRNNRVWIVDPLDGTTNFAQGFPYYGVSIACAEVQQSGFFRVIAGGVYAPSINYLFLAELGGGATCNGQSISVSQQQDLSKAYLATGIYYVKEPTISQETTRYANMARRAQRIRRFGAGAVDLCFVASGILDGFWQYGLKPWDIAAATLIIKEAGGVLQHYPEAAALVQNDNESEEVFDLRKNTLIASNFHLSGELRKALQLPK